MVQVGPPGIKARQTDRETDRQPDRQIDTTQTVQIDSGTHQASYPIVPGASRGGKAAEA
jgi:hypothetical protein